MTGVQLAYPEIEKYIIRTFNVKGTWECNAIVTPTSTVGGKVVGLSSTRRLIRKSKVVATTEETSLGGTCILGGEGRALVV